MSQVSYRRKAILSRVHSALDAFYLLQDIDWDYDVYATLERIVALAVEEIELEDDAQIERGLIILRNRGVGELEVHAGWKTEELDLQFSRTVVEETIATQQPILCENAKDDPRFMEAESIKELATLSLISVPLSFEQQCIGAFYIESKSPGNLFSPSDLEFLQDFARTIAPYLKTALTHQGHLGTIRKLREEIQDSYRFRNLIGRSESMHAIFELMRIAADVDRTVLLTGESGCGKELIAHAIHYNGRRRNHPFVVVDCSGLSENLLESELFGHCRGAFTGASTDKTGAFEAANQGTIFLDEISDASKSMQQKLRRVLQEGEIRRVGDNQVREVDVRVICATNKNLDDLVRAGEFIRDLYFRINKFPIRIPPLRDRREDVPALVDHFVKNAAEQVDKPVPSVAPSAMAALMSRDWSENNVRELRNVVELAIDLSSNDEVSAKTIERVFSIQAGTYTPRRSSSKTTPTTHNDRSALVQIHTDSFRRLLEESEANESPRDKKETPFYLLQLESAARAILEGLRSSKWKLRPAARLLGISPTKLRTELRDFLERSLAEDDGDLSRTSRRLDIPEEVLQKKARDLGLESLASGEQK